MKKVVLSILILIAVIVFIYINMDLTQEKKKKPVVLTAVEQTLKVNGKSKKAFNIIRENGEEGYVGIKGDDFNVRLVNKTSVPISIHWHGIVLPNDQDGVPYVTQLPIQPGKSHDYHYPLLQAGTYWMHSHFKFHEQDLMTAPLILKDPQQANLGDKDVIVMFQSFTFKNPEKIFWELQHQADRRMSMQNGGMHAKADLNDVKFDAVLANRHTLQNPQIIQVKPGEKVRLRLINGSSASNYWVYTGKLEGTAIAVDGNDIHPIKNNAFQTAVAQRIDVEVTISEQGGAFPILGQIEGTGCREELFLQLKERSYQS